MRARISLAVLAATALSAASSIALLACQGDDTNTPLPPATDAGTDGTVADAGHPSDGGTTTDGATTDGGPSGDAGDAAVPALKHIFYIMMENHGYEEIIGNTADAPHLNTLANSYGLATNYYGVTHPSLPNYLAAVSGDFQGIWDDCAAGSGVTCPPEEFIPGSGDGTATQGLTDAEVQGAAATPHMFSGATLVDQLGSAGKTWKAYMQSIPGVGSTVVSAPVDTVDAGDGGTTQVARGLYAQKHDPFMYFAGSATDAGLQQVVPFTQLDADLAAAASTPNFVWISPDQCHDMHGVSPDNAAAVGIPTCGYPASGLDHGAITLGDTFVNDTVTKIMAAPAWAEGSAIVIVWDEDDYTGYTGCCGSPTGADGGTLGGAKVPAIVITSKAGAGHVTQADALNHYSLLATIETIWGLPCLANACNVPAKMTSLFNP
ncbi:MAG TPA: alkaline phosphatase family protein [Polyangiaceae bacterium]|jgi:hypothetical protein